MSSAPLKLESTVDSNVDRATVAVNIVNNAKLEDLANVAAADQLVQAIDRHLGLDEITIQGRTAHERWNRYQEARQTIINHLALHGRNAQGLSH